MKSRIVIQKDFSYLYCNKSIYSKKNIIQTSEVYKDFIKSSIQELGDYFILKIELIDTSFTYQEIGNEFFNYLNSKEYEVSY